MKHWRYIIALSAMALSACSSNTVKDTLGLNRSAPDEFRVVSRPPLSVPPEFTLRPPDSAAMLNNQPSASQKAQSLVLGAQPAATATGTSVAPLKAVDSRNNKASVPANNNADMEFLKQAGADKADPKVRNELVEDTYVKQEKKEESPWWDIWSSPPEKPDTQVDAQKEADRIKKTQDAGQPVTTGDTPEVKAPDRGILGRVLGN